MAREILLEDGRTALFDDDATDSDIEKKLKSQNLTRATGAVNPATGRSDMSNLPAGAPFVASTINSMAFGLPELVARGLGAGSTIDEIRRQYPGETTAGDVAGLLNPATLGVRLAGKGMTALGTRMLQRPGSEAGQEAAMGVMRGQPTLVQQAGRYLARPAGQAAGGVVGAQIGAAALGGARQPTDTTIPFYGPAGAQQGAQVFREAAMNAPLTGLVPGLQSTIGAVTTPVPAAIGYGSAAIDMALERQMREEAARRALQGQR